MVLVDLNAEIKTLEGDPVKQDNSEDAENVTLGFVLKHILLNHIHKDMTGEQKAENYSLAYDMTRSKTPHSFDMPVDQVSKLKKAVGEVYGPSIVGPVWAMLDPKE